MGFDIFLLLSTFYLLYIERSCKASEINTLRYFYMDISKHNFDHSFDHSVLILGKNRAKNMEWPFGLIDQLLTTHFLLEPLQRLILFRFWRFFALDILQWDSVRTGGLTLSMQLRTSRSGVRVPSSVPITCWTHLCSAGYSYSWDSKRNTICHRWKRREMGETVQWTVSLLRRESLKLCW